MDKRHQSDDAECQIAAEDRCQVQIVDLLRGSLRRLDRCEVDRADVHEDDGHHGQTKYPVNNGARRRCWPGGIRRHSSIVWGKANVHAVRNTRSNAMSILSQGSDSLNGRPASSRCVVIPAAMTIGMKNGRLNIGKSNSASRVFTAIDANSVPTATNPTVASAVIANSTGRASTGRL